MTDRRKFMQGALALPAMAAGQWDLRAEESWPARTITIVVPFPPGGVADYAARPLAAFLSDTLGKNVVVENKGGAGGGIGHAYVARSEPDGYTIMTALPSLAVTYEVNQFVPLGRLLADPTILAVNKSAPWSSLDELIADVRSKPGQIPYGTSGH